MRRIQVLVTDDELEAVTAMLDEEEFDYVRQRAWRNDEKHWLVEIPTPTDGIGYILDQLADADVDDQEYTMVSSLESSMTPASERLQDRFSNDFDPLTRAELRSKSRDMARDPTSFLAMVFLSAVIAVAGLLIESPAVVVGSMVIAPLVGPVLTAAVGAVTNDRKMLLKSIWLQGAGLAIAIVGAVAVSYGLQASGFFAPSLDIASIDLIALRIAPNFVTLLIGLAAGGAGAYGLMTKGPTSLIGVMIAAALIPAAGTVGIAMAWGEYRIAIGSTLLLVLSMIVINLGAFLALRWFYSPAESSWLFSAPSFQGRATVVVSIIALLAIVLVVGGASVQQMNFERTIQGEVEDVVQTPEYGEVELVTAQTEYMRLDIPSPATVTVVVSRPTEGSDTPALADELDRRITEATDREVHVRVRYREYHHAGDSEQATSVGDPRRSGLVAVRSTVPTHLRY